jgi:hypothetical protein
MEKTVKIKWNGEDVEITLRQLTWGEHKAIREKSVVIQNYEGKPMQFRNVDLMDDLKILRSIVAAPFESIMENLDQLSEADRYKLVIAVTLLDGDEIVIPNVLPS